MDMVFFAKKMYCSVFRKPSLQSGGFVQFTRKDMHEQAYYLAHARGGWAESRERDVRMYAGGPVVCLPVSL